MLLISSLDSLSDSRWRLIVATAKTRRWLIPTILSGGVLCVLICCGGFGYVAYRYVHTIVETFEPASLPTLDGVTVDINVSPQERTDDGFGDRLVGPPYYLSFLLRDPNGRMTRARLHSVRIAPSGDDEFSVPVTSGDNPVSEFGVVSLRAHVERESLGAHCQLVADIEVVMPTGSVRKELTFSLRRGTRASLNVP